MIYDAVLCEYSIYNNHLFIMQLIFVADMGTKYKLLTMTSMPQSTLVPFIVMTDPINIT